VDYQAIFQEYYALFRGDNSIPGITDPEWAIGVYAGNRAIRRWANVDGEEWDVLWDVATNNGFAQTYNSSSNSPVLTSYACPVNMARPGGFIQMTDPVSGSYIHIGVVKLQDVQFQTASAPWAYFTGGIQTGWTLWLNFMGTSNNGWAINFPMYKKPTYFNSSFTPSEGAPDGTGNVLETGSTVTECPDPSFIINSMLGARLFSTRNPFFQQANKDSEVALKGMQIKNGTGTPGNTWNLNDNNKTGNFGPNNTPAVTNSGFGF
jgi:hypothetical protein